MKGRPFGEPSLLPGNDPNPAALDPARLGLGNNPVALTHPHAVNHLSIFVHLEPPVAHLGASRHLFAGSMPKLIRSETLSSTLLFQFAVHPVVPLRRSRFGTIP
jgi:hypothetical protein